LRANSIIYQFVSTKKNLKLHQLIFGFRLFETTIFRENTKNYLFKIRYNIKLVNQLGVNNVSKSVNLILIGWQLQDK